MGGLAAPAKPGTQPITANTAMAVRSRKAASILSKDAMNQGEIWQEYNTLSTSAPVLREPPRARSNLASQVPVFQ
jgi:hypothetical protein